MTRVLGALSLLSGFSKLQGRLINDYEIGEYLR